MMCVLRAIFFVSLVLSGFHAAVGTEGINHHSAHRSRQHKNFNRKHRAANDSSAYMHFEPKPYNKNLELHSPGKIHCKVAGGEAPTVQWFLNESDPLPEGVSSANGTLLVASAEKGHAGRYTCLATDKAATISTEILVSVVVSPKVLEPLPNSQVHVAERRALLLPCRAAGDPPPTTHWDRNLTILNPQQEGVDVEGGVNASNARLLLLRNGSLWLRSARQSDSDRYGCTAGSAAGLARAELLLTVHPEGYGGSGEEGGGAARAVLVACGVAAAYMLLVLALMLYCRRRRQERRQRGEKMELEMAEGREKLVEEGEDKPRTNGVPAPNGKLPHDRDSGADTSEVSAASRSSRRGFEHLAVPRTLITEQITLGRGEFGEVCLARVDVAAIKRLRAPAPASASASVSAPRLRPVLVKALSTKDEALCAEFRRVLEVFSSVRHENVARLLATCAGQPSLALLEHAAWGDLKSFLVATRSPEQAAAFPGGAGGTPSPLSAQHTALLAAQLAAGCGALAQARLTHRDIAARNCAVSPALRLKLTHAALSRGPDAAHYYKLHDQVVPLRWLPAEALEGEYSAKSDAYMYAATVWEIYTRAELPFAKLSDATVLEKLRGGSLEWTVPGSMPDALASLLKRCWSESPAARPQFEEICAETAAILQAATDGEALREPS